MTDGHDAASGPPLAAVLREAAGRLSRAGVAAPRADSELLAGHVLGLSRGEVIAVALAGRPIEADARDTFSDLVDQRARRVPLQHLTGRAPFRGLELEVGPGVFVPRPETETVAGVAIDALATLARAEGPTATPLAVDLCTGSGAIALAVAVEVPTARVVALERETLALAWAERNLATIAPGRVELRAGDVTTDVAGPSGVLCDLAGRVDVVVSNPPYIPPDARPVDPEVADHDPEAALYGGGADGLAVPRAVVRAARALLRPGGLLVMEHGDPQGAACRELTPAPRWAQVRTVTDLAGRDRALVARLAS